MLVDNDISQGAIADGPAVIDGLSIEAERHYVSIIFYTNAAMTTVADATAGSIDIMASETGEQYGMVATIAANTTGEDSTYDRPLIAGAVVSVRASFTGIVGGGATHYKLKVTGFDNQ